MCCGGAPKGGATEGWGHRRVGPPKGGAPEGCGPPKGGAPEGWGPRRVGPPKGGAPEGWGPTKGGAPEGWGPRRVGPPKGGAPEGWGPRRVGPPKGGAPEGWGPRRVGPPKGGAPEGWGPRRVGPPKGGGPKISRFVFPLPPQFFTGDWIKLLTASALCDEEACVASRRRQRRQGGPQDVEHRAPRCWFRWEKSRQGDTFHSEGAHLAPCNQATLTALTDPTMRPLRAREAIPEGLMEHIPRNPFLLDKRKFSQNLRPPGLAHDSLRAQTCTFEVPVFKNTTKIPRKRPPERKERMKFSAGESRKSANFWAPHPSGPPHFGAPPFGAPPLEPPPFPTHTSAQNTQKKKPKQKI